MGGYMISRSGFGSYYRFGPRRLSKLCNQIFSRTLKDEVYVDRPKIHESVLKRIKNGAHVYAPIGIPETYDVVVTDTTNPTATLFRLEALPSALAAGSAASETVATALARVHSERRVIWPLVYLHSLLYIVTVLTTALFIAFPLSGRPDPLNEIGPLRWLSDVIRAVSGFLPSWASDWFVGYASHPVQLIVFVTTLSLLIFATGRIASSTRDRMALLWKSSLAQSIADPGSPNSVLYRWGIYLLNGLEICLKEYLIPALTAIVLIYAVVFGGSHAAFNIFDDAGLTCVGADKLLDVPEQGVLISYKPSELCHASGYRIGRLDRYLVWTNPEPAALAAEHPNRVIGPQSCSPAVGVPLKNGDVVTGPAGYSTFHNRGGGRLTWPQTISHFLLAPLRRDLFRPWFEMIARYGKVGGEEEFLDPDPDPSVKDISEIVQPKIKGELFFYVNDAVIGIPGLFDQFYHDNTGCISVFIQPK